MNLKKIISRRGFILIAGTYFAMSSACVPLPTEISFDGYIDGKRVVYLNGWERFGIRSPDEMRVYDNNTLSAVIRDFNRNGIIGDDGIDSYTRLDNGKEITYGMYFMTDENGKKHDVSKQGKLKLCEITEVYRRLKPKIRDSKKSINLKEDSEWSYDCCKRAF